MDLSYFGLRVQRKPHVSEARHGAPGFLVGLEFVWQDELVGDREQRKFKARGDAGLVEDIRQVALDRLFRDVELACDVLVAAAFDDALDDFQFARRQPVGLAFGNGGGLLHQLVQGLEQVGDAFAADPVIAL